MWYAAAIQEDRVFATAFSPREQEVLRHLLGNLPYNVPFQVTEKPNQLLTELLKTLREIFDGKDNGPYGFKIALGHLPSYTRRVLNRTSLIPVGYLTTYGAIAKVAGGKLQICGTRRSLKSVSAVDPMPPGCTRRLQHGGYGLGEKVKLGLLLEGRQRLRRD